MIYIIYYVCFEFEAVNRCGISESENLYQRNSHSQTVKVNWIVFCTILTIHSSFTTKNLIASTK